MSYIYQYRLKGQTKVWQVRSSYDLDEMHEALERKVGKLDLLLLVRSATAGDSRLPYINTEGVSAATWDAAVAKLRGEGIADYKPAADTWDKVMSDLRGKDKVDAEPIADTPADDGWDAIVARITKDKVNA